MPDYIDDYYGDPSCRTYMDEDDIELYEYEDDELELIY